MEAVKFKNISLGILALILSACAIFLTWRLNGTLVHVQDTAAVAQATADDLRVAVKEQIEVFRSPAYQKNYEHASELGDIAAKTVAQLARRTLPRADRALDELTARLTRLDEVLLSVRGVSDEARTQVRQNGDAATRAVGSLDKAIRDSGEGMAKLLQDGSLMIETANPKLQDALSGLKDVVVTANGTIEAYRPIGVNLAEATGHLSGVTADTEKYVHNLLFPPVKTGWARVGQILTYIYRPVFDGARLYYTLTSLPVRLTQPIPTAK